MDVESAFKISGTMGRFQKYIAVSHCLLNIPYGFQMVLMVIAGATPNMNITSERNMTTIVTEWHLEEETWIVDLISSIFMAGYGLGCVVMGQLSDLYGRKIILLINFSGMLVATACCYFAPNWETFAALRTISGFCAGGSGHVVFALAIENIGKEYWGLVGMVYSVFFSMGVMLLSLLGWALQDWRKLCLIGSMIPMVYLPIYIFILPESCRWLYRVGKVKEAEKVLHYIAKKNGRPTAGLTLRSTDDCELSRGQDLKKYSMVDIFRRPKLTIYALACFYIWFACSFVYYGLAFDAASLSPNIFIANTLSGAIEYPAVFLCYFTISYSRIGRKGTMFGCFVLSSVAGIGLLFASAVHSEYLQTIQTVLGLTNKLAVAGGFALLYIYTAEIFPTQLRLVAIGGSSLFARVGAIISPFVPLLAPVKVYLPYLIFGVVSFVGAIFNIILPETLNKPSPEMSDFRRRNESESEINDDYSINGDDTEPLVTV